MWKWGIRIQVWGVEKKNPRTNTVSGEEEYYNEELQWKGDIRIRVWRVEGKNPRTNTDSGGDECYNEELQWKGTFEYEYGEWREESENEHVYWSRKQLKGEL
ncbi:hypothetical protein WA026_005457 [Henosepilachna vigintioctopunctata]|uniref:Uncharacterized protein n=1 Tax=Henosepilachna vigintioctopunctata TaxID=420089 RepID=A0AAW1U1U6_9CUCU